MWCGGGGVCACVRVCVVCGVCGNNFMLYSILMCVAALTAVFCCPLYLV